MHHTVTCMERARAAPAVVEAFGRKCTQIILLYVHAFNLINMIYDITLIN